MLVLLTDTPPTTGPKTLISEDTAAATPSANCRIGVGNISPI